MKNLLIVLSLMCSLCLQAKDGKIKYGKYVIYEGGIENKQPHGQGVLKLINPKRKGITDVEISGIFDGDNVSDAKIFSPSNTSNQLTIRNININYSEPQGKCTHIDVIISNSMITSIIQNSANEQIPSMKIDDLRLSFSIWIPNWLVIYSGNLMGSYSPHKLSPILTKLQYSLDMVDHVTEEFSIVNKSGLLEIAKLEFHGTSSPIYTMKNGIIVQDNKITYPNGSIVEVNDGSWSGFRIFSNGTKVSYNNSSKTLDIYRSNGDAYRGTIKGGIFYPLYANVNEPKFIIDTGTQIMGGVTTEWIKGETKENLRERLKNTLSEKWLAMVENGKLSENEAIKQQKEENDRIAKAAREKERKERALARGEITSMDEGELLKNVCSAIQVYRRTLIHRAYDGSTKEHYYNEIEQLLNNDVGYLRLENVKTELQKKTFVQTEEYKSIYQPRMQKEREYLFQDEYMIKLPLTCHLTDDIRSFKYDIKTGKYAIRIVSKDKKINEGEKDFYILFNQLCLSYPRSLIALTKGKNLLDDILYQQDLSTCKVSESSALKVENNIQDCEMVWVFKFKKAKGGYGYGDTTHIYIVNKNTGEIYCDLTGSLSANRTKLQSFTNITSNSKKKYHERGRLEKCAACMGTGLFMLGSNNERCLTCGGDGYVIEHYW